MIRLGSEFRLDKYWREVRQTGDDRLKDLGFDDWVVTVQPLTLVDSERSRSHEGEPVVNLSVATKVLEIAVAEQPDLPPESFVQTSIIDIIEQAMDPQANDDLEDWPSDEGGEA